MQVSITVITAWSSAKHGRVQARMYSRRPTLVTTSTEVEAEAETSRPRVRCLQTVTTEKLWRPADE